MKKKSFLLAFIILLFISCPPPNTVEILEITDISFSYPNNKNFSNNYILSYGEKLEIRANYKVNKEDSSVGFRWYINDQRVESANTASLIFSQTPEIFSNYKIRIEIFEKMNTRNVKSHEITIKVLEKNSPEIFIFNIKTQEKLYDKMFASIGDVIKLQAKAEIDNIIGDITDWKVQWLVDNEVKSSNSSTLELTIESNISTITVRATHPHAGYTKEVSVSLRIPNPNEPIEIMISNQADTQTIKSYTKITIKTTTSKDASPYSYQWSFKQDSKDKEIFIGENSTQLEFFWKDQIDIISTFIIEVSLLDSANVVVCSSSIEIIVEDDSFNVGNFNIENFDKDGDLTYTTFLDNEKLYFVFVNKDKVTSPDFSLGDYSFSANITAPPQVRKFTENLPATADFEASVSRSPEADPGLFYDYNNTPIEATLRYESPTPIEVSTDLTKRKLKIWVANKDRKGHDIWKETISNNDDYINKGKLDFLADKFLNTSDDCIFKYVINLLGPEWSIPLDPLTMIPFNGEVNILLSDLELGYLGYFHARDNYKNQNFSNQRIMFTVDSSTFAKRKTALSSWNINDEGPSAIISTLAHELQHMIHFHHKFKKSVSNIHTWTNELSAMMVEDILANTLQTNGPRGFFDEINNGSKITEGRLPLFNQVPNTQLAIADSTTWGSGNLDDQLVRYSTSYSFGSYLIATHGRDVLKEMVQNSYSGIESVEKALSAKGYSTKFDRLLQQWAISILLSKKEISPSPETKKYIINSGTWLIDEGPYKLASVNYFNIIKKNQPASLGPKIHTVFPNSMEAYSIYFAHPNAIQNGMISFENLHIPSNILVSIIKEKLE